MPGNEKGAADKDPKSFTFDQVREAESLEIAKAREERAAEYKGAGLPRGVAPLAAEYYVGLGFSGGGIRSATFNLGVLQGLAELGLLPAIDYLSTVSGGGYIGTWLTAWIHRQSLPTVEKGLTGSLSDSQSSVERTAVESGQEDRKNTRNGDCEAREIRFLREYSNYLTPKLGLASGDTWAFIGSYIRNLILNQIILVLILLAVLLLPRPFVMYFWQIAATSSSLWKIPVIAGLLLCLGLGTTLANLSSQAQDNRPKQDFKSALASPTWIAVLVVFPIVAALWLLWAWFWSIYAWWKATNGSLWHLGLITGAAFVVLWLLGWIGGEYFRALAAASSAENGKAKEAKPQEAADKKTEHVRMAHHAMTAAEETFARRRFSVLRIVAWAGPAGLVGGLLTAVFAEKLKAYVDLPNTPIKDWQAVSWGFPIVVLIFLLMQTLHIGLAGREFTEDAREWWGRLGGAITLVTIYGCALFFISLDGPWLIGLLPAKFHSGKWILTTLWAAVTGSGLIAGKSAAKPNEQAGTARTVIAKVAPPVFIIGLLLILSDFANSNLKGLIDGTHDIIGIAATSGFHSVLGKWPVEVVDPSSDWGKIAVTVDGCLWFYIAAFFLLALFLSWREGINRFSMHSLYRNRLVRCYLGASNRDRKPQPFTGMDPRDDSVSFSNLHQYDQDANHQNERYSGPYPIYNTALNLVSSEDLAWQQRKAASFVFTPMYTGFEFRDANGNPVEALQRTRGLGDRLRLGLAMAISGAAASPNMGSHSEPALSFLMTVFNVRLGWWLGNPYPGRKWGRLGPQIGLFYLFNELLGRTNHKSNYVYLSDGGHFENLGIYELVRRKCRFIIVCDAGEDHLLHFSDLGNAIEKCRTDFGVDIEIDVEQLRKHKDSNYSKWHCAVGTIHYEYVDDTVPSGTLLYLKSTLTGDEPTDVQRYADECPEFPHQSTADQWFTESQFESYRALGHHIVQSAIGVIGDRKELARQGVEEIFVKLSQHWYPPSRYVAASFTKHTATYTRLLEKLRTNEDLHFLGEQVYPEWPNLMGQSNQSKKYTIWLPAKEDERRAGFYFCNEVIQLMEDAYLDLHLEADYDHPDNRGWMNLFRHWSWSGMFVATWSISAGIYGARFQSFCERRLDLNAGRMTLGKPVPVEQARKAGKSGSDSGSDAQNPWGVDAWEAELINAFAQKMRKSDLQLYVVPFRVLVPSPRDHKSQDLEFNVGYALLEMAAPDADKAEIVYFRIQDHMRKMGMARLAIAELLRAFKGGLRNSVSAGPAPDEAADLPGGSSLLEAFPTREASLHFWNLFESVNMRESHVPSTNKSDTKPT
jgi:hypothetical protein